MALPQVADGGTASNMAGSCEYIKKAVADTRQSVVLQLGGWARFKQLLTVKTYLVKKCFREPRTWTDTLVRPKQRKRGQVGCGVWTRSSWLGIGTGGGHL